jgi:hypothetical protein
MKFANKSVVVTWVSLVLAICVITPTSAATISESDKKVIITTTESSLIDFRDITAAKVVINGDNSIYMYVLPPEPTATSIAKASAISVGGYVAIVNQYPEIADLVIFKGTPDVIAYMLQCDRQWVVGDELTNLDHMSALLTKVGATLKQ